MHMRQLQEMDTCLRRYLRGEGLVSNPSENSLRHTKHLFSQEPDQVPFWLWVAGSGWRGSERRSDARLGRSGQGELAKASWAVEEQKSCQWHDFPRQASSGALRLRLGLLRAIAVRLLFLRSR